MLWCARTRAPCQCRCCIERSVCKCRKTNMLCAEARHSSSLLLASEMLTFVVCQMLLVATHVALLTARCTSEDQLATQHILPGHCRIQQMYRHAILCLTATARLQNTHCFGHAPSASNSNGLQSTSCVNNMHARAQFVSYTAEHAQ